MHILTHTHTHTRTHARTHMHTWFCNTCRCGNCRKYMKVIEGVPLRVLCESCNKFFSLPPRGNIKPYEVWCERSNMFRVQSPLVTSLHYLCKYVLL